jgi:hypothetical protein
LGRPPRRQRGFKEAILKSASSLTILIHTGHILQLLDRSL